MSCLGPTLFIKQTWIKTTYISNLKRFACENCMQFAIRSYIQIPNATHCLKETENGKIDVKVWFNEL